MTKTMESKSKKTLRGRSVTTWRFILLGPSGGWTRLFRTVPSVTCCEADKIQDVLSQASRGSVWISPGAGTTDELLRNLTLLWTVHHGRPSHIGHILMLEPPRVRVLPILHSLFEEVIGEAPAFRMLPLDQLADVFSAPEEEARNVFIGGAVDVTSGTLALVRGNLERISVPLAMFRPSGTTRPDFRRFELDDYGHTIRFGEYEAAADAVLYELDSDYRKRIDKKRRAEEKGFGPSLRRLRLQKGLARDRFPGVAAKTIARLERGEVAKPQGRTLRTIAEALEVEPDQIETF
jgi:hypothetical protein